mgnify:CR=1 FL=1
MKTMSRWITSLAFDVATQHEQAWKMAVADLACLPGVIFDLGGGRPFQGSIRPEMLGVHTRYFSLDIRFEAMPHVVGDIMRLPLADESVDGILCNAVLEHVPYPQAAVNEMYRVLKFGGILMAGVPFIYPYHDIIDYFRFSDTALKEMFHSFHSVEIKPLGDYIFSTALFLTGFNFDLAKRLGLLTNLLRFLLRTGTTVSSQFRTKSNEIAREGRVQRTKRRWQESLERSPVGWYVHARK